MKHSGLWRMAVTSWRRVGFLAVFAAALGTFCLAVALNGFLTVRQEKGAPCQMAATASALDEAKLSEVKKLEGVLDATLVIDTPAVLKVGDYQAELSLQGVGYGYLQEEYLEGEGFPSSANMPYIVLNQAAMELFTDENGKPLRKDQTLDWQDGKTVLDGEKPVTAKICGILADDSPEPRAYLNLEAAKNMIRRGGGVPAYTGMWIRAENLGAQARLSETLMKLGLMAELTDPEQVSLWEQKETEALYLGLTGFAVLLAACWVMWLRTERDLLIQAPAYEALAFLGVTKRELDRMLLWRQIFCGLWGCAMGLAVAGAVPYFIAEEGADATVYAYPLGLAAVGLALALHLILWLVLYLQLRRQRNNRNR